MNGVAVEFIAAFKVNRLRSVILGRLNFNNRWR
ncbi:hypothetical protein WwAna1727 [Wolbachia endosymbiont of Drosophila ananassae]|nr:hypothetical protein WwAna0138 [Wolbachia endosymbiont of Drosophila ananassae]EAL58825.1 hypothetical protein WwAna1727 [Wolbachia endosymbiont of Drosophila ananassae]